jgi:hypothetical protein
MKKQVLIFITVFFALFFILTNSATTYATTASDGSSFEKAIVIKADNEIDGVTAEYDWLKSKYPGYKLNLQKLVMHNDKPYDLLTIITQKGEEKVIYFDISNFFGKF